MALTQVDQGMLGTNAQYTGFKNRIYNGQMQIDQRNAGASVTPINNQYTLDRWAGSTTQSSKFTIQQNAGSVTPPAGFTNYLGVTSSSAYSVVSTDYFGVMQLIEGYNVADLAYNTASAQPVTLSFWVRASIAGTYSAGLFNSVSGNRSFMKPYTVSASNTWQYVSITIPGDTAASVASTTNGTGLYAYFSIGAGSTFTMSGSSWTTGVYLAYTGQTSVVGTNGATFYITGVQLEKGSTATSFDYRPYGTELFLCQRYYAEIPSVSGASTGVGRITGTVNSTSGNPIVGNLYLPVPMRAAPGVTAYGGGKSGSGSISTYSGGSGGQVTYNTNVSGLSVPFISANMFALNLASIGSTQSGYSTWTDMGWASSQLAFVASAEL